MPRVVLTKCRMYKVKNEDFYSETEQIKLGCSLSCLWQKTKPSNEENKTLLGIFMFEQLKHLLIPQYMRSSGSLIEIDWNRSTTSHS